MSNDDIQVCPNCAMVYQSQTGTCLYCGTKNPHEITQPAAIVGYITDDQIRHVWRQAGGKFHGPHVETATMPEVDLFKLIRGLINEH